MRYGPKEILALTATAAGRIQLREGASYRLWPLSSRLARLYRQTIVRRVRVVAVVGSFGKSTTARAVSAVLGKSPPATLTCNAWGSVSVAVLRIRPFQPHAVIEIGIAQPGQMEAYARTVRPDVAVVTSVGSEHHRSLGSLDVTRAEKSRMVRILPKSGAAVLNGDDPNVMWMKAQTEARIVTFGFGESCDVRADGVRLEWPHGTRFRLFAFGAEREVTIRLVGRSMVYSALAAIAVSQLEGIALDDALARLAALPPTPGRMQPVSLPGDIVLLRDDFKSPLETMHSALDVLGEIPARRRIVLLGDVSEPPGPQRRIYQALGERVAAMASHFVVVGHGLEAYHSGARRGGMTKAAIVDGGRTPRQAADALRELLQPGDVVLIKGRDTQKLARVAFILQGRRVMCDIRFCNLRTIDCAGCPMLETGWGTHQPVM